MLCDLASEAQKPASALERIAHLLDIPVAVFLDRKDWVVASSAIERNDGPDCRRAQLSALIDAFLAIESVQDRERCIAFVRAAGLRKAP